MIDRTLQGDAEAFGALVRRYQDRLYTSMIHVLGNEEDARDIVQDAFVQALSKLDSFARKSSFYTWIYRIAFNLAVNRRKRESREREILGDNATHENRSPSADHEVERRENIQQVQRALALLDEPFRAVLVLREIEQLDYRTIAEILEIEVGTVRSRLHRARVMLRDTLTRLLAQD